MKTQGTMAAQLNTIDSFLAQVGRTMKSAEVTSEVGSIGGSTTHPVKDIDDRLKPATEGARSKENTSDVKEDQGAVSVDAAATPQAKAAAVLARFKKAEGPVMTPGSATDDQIQIGTKKAPTGEDKANETSSAKSGKEDPGSSHPARTDNDSIDGHKYAADGPLGKAAQDLAQLGNRICQSIVKVAQDAERDQYQYRNKTASANQNQWKPDTQTAYQAGWEMPAITSGNFDKRAADAMVTQSLEVIIKQASDDADALIELYDRQFRQKKAEGGMPPAPLDAMGAPEGGMGGSMPEASPGGEGEGTGGEDSMLSAIGGLDGGGEMGGMEGGMGGGEGGAGGEDEMIQTLLQYMQENNITPEELEAEMAQEGGAGGAPAEMPAPAAGNEPPPEPEPTPEEKTAATKKAINDVLTEILARGRNRKK